MTSPSKAWGEAVTSPSHMERIRAMNHMFDHSTGRVVERPKAPQYIDDAPTPDVLDSELHTAPELLAAYAGKFVDQMTPLERAREQRRQALQLRAELVEYRRQVVQRIADSEQEIRDIDVALLELPTPDKEES